MLVKQDCYLFAKKCKDNFYNLIIADPPYFETVKNEWDNQWNDDREYLDWLKKCLIEFSRILSPNGNLILYCKRQLLHHIKIILDKYLVEQRTIIWVRRRNTDITRGKTLASGYEPILWYSKSDDFIFNSENAKIAPEQHLQHRKEYRKGGVLENGVGLTDAWTDISALPHNSKEKVDHPTQKPLILSERIINLFSLPNGNVYIPFAGSGSEIIAAIHLNRKWYATEINSKYIDIINTRLGSIDANLDKYITH